MKLKLSLLFLSSLASGYVRSNDLIDRNEDKNSIEAIYATGFFNGQTQKLSDAADLELVHSNDGIDQDPDDDSVEANDATEVVNRQEPQVHDYSAHLGLMRSNDLTVQAKTEEQTAEQTEEQTAAVYTADHLNQQEGQDYTFNLGLTLSPVVVNTNQQSIYAGAKSMTRISKYKARNEVDFRFAKGGLNIQGLLRQSLENKQPSQYQGVLNQAYYDGQFSPGLGWTVGKKVMTWGVGFGFKPLDLVQREDVRSINAPPLLGSYIFALDQYTENRSLSVIFANPFLDRASDEKRDPSVSFRWYRLAGNNDFYGTTRLSKRRKVEAGLGFTHIINDEWSIYGSGLYQKRSHLKKNTLLDSDHYFADQDPMQAGDYGRHWKALLGAQWTGKSGLSVLFEGWYDGDAYKKKDWKALNELTQKQKQVAVKEMAQLLSGNVAASSQAFLAPNLLRENVLFRVSYDDSKGRKLFTDVLVTPRDGGSVFSLGFEWQRNRSKLSTGYRQYLSKENSAFGQAPIKSELWGQWRVSF